jgi:hypothetical protein
MPHHFVISCACTKLLPDHGDLTGTIPTEIGLLKILTILDLSKSIDHFRNASIAVFSCFVIMSLPKLTWKPHNFVISCSCAIFLPDDNGLNGSIPSDIGLMTILTDLDLRKSIDRFSRFDCGFCLFRYCLLPKLAWKAQLFAVHVQYF